MLPEPHATQPTFVYFDLYGPCECVRMMFAVKKAPFVDHRLKMEDWPALKMSG
jgi:hypothetical protein